MTDAGRKGPLRLETPVWRSPDGRGQDPAPTPARMFRPARNLHLDYCSHTSLSRALGTIAWGNPFPSPLLPWTRCSPAAAASSQHRYTVASCALPALALTPYQGGMCNSEVLKTAERTPHHLISHIGPNWVATDNAAWRYVHFTLALVWYEQAGAQAARIQTSHNCRYEKFKGLRGCVTYAWLQLVIPAFAGIQGLQLRRARLKQGRKSNSHTPSKYRVFSSYTRLRNCSSKSSLSRVKHSLGK